MNNTRNVIVETFDKPFWDFKSELRLEHDGTNCNWIVRAWPKADETKTYEEKFTSYRKAWKAFGNAMTELERRFNWGAHFDQAAWDKCRAIKPEQLTVDADAEALLAGLEDL